MRKFLCWIGWHRWNLYGWSMVTVMREDRCARCEKRRYRRAKGLGF